MDKEHEYPNKKTKKKSIKNQITKQKNHQNETEEKFVLASKNELTTKDNDNLQDLSTNKNLDTLLSNKLQSFINNKENKQISSNTSKKHNQLQNTLIKQKNNFPKHSIINLLISRSNSDKLIEPINQSSSLLLINKFGNNHIDQNHIMQLNKNQNNEPQKKNNIKTTNSSKNIKKKVKVKIYSNSISSPCLSKDNSKNFTKKRRLSSPKNLDKIIKNPNLSYFQKSENKLTFSDFIDDNRSQNKQKNLKKKKKSLRKSSKKKLTLSNNNYKNLHNILRKTKSLNTPKNLKNNVKIKQKKNPTLSPTSPASQSNNNSCLNLKSEHSFTPKNRMRYGLLEKKNKSTFQKNTKEEITFSKCMQECNNNFKFFSRKKEKSKTIFLNKNQRNSLKTTLILNKPNEIKDKKKLMSIMAMDEVHKKIKKSIHQIDKKELLKEIRDLETNDICEAIEKLPTIKNNSVNKDNSSICNKNENISVNEKNKIKFKNTKTSEKNFYESSRTKLMVYHKKYRKLIHKVLVYDSLDDEEKEEIDIDFFYLAPNSITIYLIDSIILITSLIQLLYLPLFLAHNFEFCRNNFSIQQIMFYLIDLFYILDFITGFFRAYYNFDEFLVKNTKKIFKNYFRSWFFFDLLEAIPLYIILNIMEKECKSNNIYYSKYYNHNIYKMEYIFLLIKILKIFKVISTNTTLQKIKSKLNNYEFFFQYKFIFFTIFAVFSSLNISSCLFIFVGRNSYPGWITKCNMQNDSFEHIYLASIYYLIVTVTTVGYGDIIVATFTERIYQIIILIVGTCAYSWSITYISNYIKKIHEKSMDLEKKLSILKDIKLTSENMSTELYIKIRRYLQYNRVEKKNNNEILINCLPYPLKNNLFMEMYKPIIHNFKFFKCFENSNFICKVVTSFKPVLSIKNDILVQEGDFIEDIIFVKDGVLSLEICIDLDNTQESIESYLNEKGFGKKTIIKKKEKKIGSHLYTDKSSFNFSQIKLDGTLSNFIKEKEKEINLVNKKYLRVLDIRKNEYYGDILMFLNERAPLRVKVKSKKAELFYLNKTDAIETSTLYPHIWKRIIQKSLFNMKQIKNLTRKILIYFAKLNGIFLDEEMCKDISSDSSLIKSNSNDNSQIKENVNVNNSWKKNNKEDEFEIKNNINFVDSSVIYEDIDESIESKLNYENTETTKRNSKNSNINNIKLNINHDELKSIKNISNNIKNNKDLELKFKTDSVESPEQNVIENSNDLEDQKTKKFSISNNVNSFSDFSEIKEYCSQISNENEINSEIYSTEKLNDYKYLQSDFSEHNKNQKNIDKEKNAAKKLIIKYTDNQSNLSYEKEIKCENVNHSLKIIYKKLEKFENLTIVNTTSATIPSIYENLNQITKYKFSKDINFRKKTIQFFIDSSNQISSINSPIASNFFSKIRNSSCILIKECPKKYTDSTTRNRSRLKIPNNDEEPSSIISFSKEELSDYKDIKSNNNLLRRKSTKFSRKDNSKHLSPDLDKSNVSKKFYNQYKVSKFHRSVKDVCRLRTERLFDNVNKKGINKKISLQNLDNLAEDKELNFYGKMKTLRVNNKDNNISTINNNNIDALKSPTKKKNYLDMISHNIFENRQTLNNPQEFYMDFFTNIVQKKFNERKKFSKVRSEVNLKKIDEVNKNRIRYNKSLFDKNDRKIKNKCIKKKQLSTNNVLKVGNALFS